MMPAGRFGFTNTFTRLTHIEILGRNDKLKVLKWGKVEPFDLSPSLEHWLVSVTPSCGTDPECLCRESFNSIYKYIKLRLELDKQREILKEKIDSGKFDKHVNFT